MRATSQTWSSVRAEPASASDTATIRGSDNFLLCAEATGRECQVLPVQQDDLMGIEFCRTDAIKLAVREQLDREFDLLKRDVGVHESVIECHGCRSLPVRLGSTGVSTISSNSPRADVRDRGAAGAALPPRGRAGRCQDALNWHPRPMRRRTATAGCPLEVVLAEMGGTGPGSSCRPPGGGGALWRPACVRVGHDGGDERADFLDVAARARPQ